MVWTLEEGVLFLLEQEQSELPFGGDRLLRVALMNGLDSVLAELSTLQELPV
jgi:hypothetical protein